MTDFSFKDLIERMVMGNGSEKLKLDFYYNSLDANLEMKFVLTLNWDCPEATS